MRILSFGAANHAVGFHQESQILLSLNVSIRCLDNFLRRIPKQMTAKRMSLAIMIIIYTSQVLKSMKLLAVCKSI